MLSHGAASTRPLFWALCRAGSVVMLLALTGAARAQNVEAGRGKAAVCAACHGPTGNSTNPQFPVLAGQTERYLYLQLRDFKAGRRTNDAGTMSSVSKTLSDQDMDDLAHFLSGLD